MKKYRRIQAGDLDCLLSADFNEEFPYGILSQKSPECVGFYYNCNEHGILSDYLVHPTYGRMITVVDLRKLPKRITELLWSKDSELRFLGHQYLLDYIYDNYLMLEDEDEKSQNTC